MMPHLGYFLTNDEEAKKINEHAYVHFFKPGEYFGHFYEVFGEAEEMPLLICRAALLAKLQ